MRKLWIGWLALLGVTHSLWANSLDLDDNWHMGLGVGGTFPRLNSSDVGVGSGWPDDKYTVDDVEGAVLFSAFAGYTWETDNRWLPAYSLRLNYLYGLSSDVDGHIELFSLPQFTNYDYHYKVQSQMLLGVLKADLYRFGRLLPFVSVGLGGSWNRFSDYEEHVLPGNTTRISADFEDHTQGDFAYLFGAGFDFLLSEEWYLSLEYNYAGLGDVKSGGSDIYSGDSIETDIFTNIILLSVAYEF